MSARVRAESGSGSGSGAGFFGEFRCRSVAAAGDRLSFASPKESRQRKGEPKSGGLLGSDAILFA